jgi:hypothetical protein
VAEPADQQLPRLVSGEQVERQRVCAVDGDQAAVSWLRLVVNRRQGHDVTAGRRFVLLSFL